MADVVELTLVMLVAAFWGGVGGIVYWAIPDRPEGVTEFVKRFAGGLAAGAVTNVLVGVIPFDAAGAWDATGVTKLIAAGFAGVSSLGAVLPMTMNQKVKNQAAEVKRQAKEIEGLRARLPAIQPPPPPATS